MQWLLVIFLLIVIIFEAIVSSNKFKGNYGEELAIKQLKKIHSYHKILHNPIFFNTENKSCEIDIIYINETGIYVIESKNFSGWIFGSEKKLKWTQSLPNRHKSQFYNPIMQNYNHIKMLKELIGEQENYISIIAFSERCELKKIDLKSEIIVMKRNDAMQEIKKLSSKLPKIYDENKINQICDKLNQLAKFDKETRKIHIESIKREQRTKNQ